MKKRQLKRAKADKKAKADRQVFVIKTKAAETARAAMRNEPFIDCLGNFIFFSTESGEAWMLDHRHNYALRLAEAGALTDYKIRESADRFQVEWKERYRIEGELFIARHRGEEQVYEGYPVDAISGFVELLKKRRPAAPPATPDSK